MKMLVVYNPQGAILYMVPTNGTYKTVEVETPEGKMLERLDLSGEEPQAVLVDQPVNLTEKLEQDLEAARKARDELKEKQRVMELAMAEMMNFMAGEEEQG